MKAIVTSVAGMCLFLLAAVPAPAAEDRPSDSQWNSLFNGRDLEGWTPKIKGYELGDNFGNTFRVEDGLLNSAKWKSSC